MARLSAVEARTGFVSADTGRLHVRDIGQGPSILVLHGGPDFDYDYLNPPGESGDSKLIETMLPHRY